MDLAISAHVHAGIYALKDTCIHAHLSICTTVIHSRGQIQSGGSENYMVAVIRCKGQQLRYTNQTLNIN